MLVKGGGGSFGEGRKEQNGSGTREKEEGWNRDRQKTGRQTKDWQVKGRFQRKSRQKNSQTAAEAADILCSDVIRLPERLMEGRKPVFFGENLYLVPEEMPEMDGLRVLRPGLHAGTVKKGRVEPAHGSAMFLKAEEAAQAAEIGAGETAWKYLRGEVLTETGSLREFHAAKGLGSCNRGRVRRRLCKSIGRRSEKPLSKGAQKIVIAREKPAHIFRKGSRKFHGGARYGMGKTKQGGMERLALYAAEIRMIEKIPGNGVADGSSYGHGSGGSFRFQEEAGSRDSIRVLIVCQEAVMGNGRIPPAGVTDTFNG